MLRIIPQSIRAIILAGALLVMPVSVYAQDVSRPTFTWAKPAGYVTFNSITNNPSVGDERKFFLARPLAGNDYVDNLKVTDNEEVVLRAYYDNDAAANYKLEAKNVRVRIDMPAITAKSSSATAYILSDNAKPTVVSDSTGFSADQPFNLVYEPGSAQLWNNALRGFKLSDSIISQQGTIIGYNKLDGVIQSGPQYSGYVTIKARVHMAKTTASQGTVGTINGVPNTGPGNVLGLFAGASAVGAAAHMAINRRHKR
jgi:hypothetical protein